VAVAALKALPGRKAGMRMVPTGKTIAEEWDAANDIRRREMLAEFDIRVVVHPTGHDPRVVITSMAVIEDLA
jgi:site-specific DNA recombinase